MRIKPKVTLVTSITLHHNAVTACASKLPKATLVSKCKAATSHCSCLACILALKCGASYLRKSCWWCVRQYHQCASHCSCLVHITKELKSSYCCVRQCHQRPQRRHGNITRNTTIEIGRARGSEEEEEKASQLFIVSFAIAKYIFTANLVVQPIHQNSYDYSGVADK